MSILWQLSHAGLGQSFSVKVFKDPSIFPIIIEQKAGLYFVRTFPRSTFFMHECHEAHSVIPAFWHGTGFWMLLYESFCYGMLRQRVYNPTPVRACAV